jgi:hypothetical protein
VPEGEPSLAAGPERNEARERVGEPARGRGVSMPSFRQLTRLLYAEAREVWHSQTQREEAWRQEQ